MNFDISSIKRKLLIKYPFFGSITTNVNFVKNNDIPTACTDGQNIYYNFTYMENCALDKQLFIFAHEMCHIAFNHIYRSEGKEPELWNIATDGVINKFLENDGLPIPDGAINIAGADKYDAEELYKKLLSEQKSNNKDNDKKGKSGNGSSSKKDNKGNNSSNNKKSNDSKEQNNNDNSSKSNEEKQNSKKFNSHSMWSNAIKRHKEQQTSSSSDNSKENKKQDSLRKTQKDLEKLGEKESFKKNREEKRKNLEKLRTNIIGKMFTTSESRQMDNIGISKPIVDWRYVLREAVNLDVDWSYRNATTEDGVLTPHLEEYMVPETEILLDTSGSINDELLRNFLRETKNILQQSKIKVGCFDTKFYGFKDIRTLNDIEKFPLVGGGGTSFDVAIRAFSNRVENKIIFTDGYADMPKDYCDAIWIVFGEDKITPPGGKVIYVSEEDLIKLKGRNR